MIKSILSLFIALYLLSGCEGEKASFGDSQTGKIFRPDGSEITGPVADAGDDQSVVEGDEVTLDASKSSDNDGEIVSYSWVTSNGTVVSTESSFSKSDLSIGTYTLTLTVTDNDGASDSDSVVITVSRNRYPTADAGADQSVKLGEPLTLDGSASSDSDGEIVSYEWKVNDNILSTESSFSISSLLAGDYVITLSVTDNKGAISTDNVRVSVEGNKAPSADAGADQQVNPGETVYLDASGSSDSDGSIVSYEWKEGSNILSTNSSFYISTLSTATHTITLTVTDDSGESATDEVVVTVSYSIVHNGVKYNKVTSPYTNRVWLDRNVGADRVCTSFDDTQCYGDYFQWGRDSDGHEKSTSITTSAQATSLLYAGSKFITSTSLYDYDWASSLDSDGSLRTYNWSKTDGSFICPVGYRVPTLTELEAETIDIGVNNATDAFNNFLKLPSSGYRDYISGDMKSVGTYGYLLSTTVSSTSSSLLYYSSSSANSSGNYFRANGRSVRCIKD